MTRPALQPREARPIVEARLGRSPQDMLEVAVVLEAWAGVPAGEALATGRRLMRSSSAASQPSAGRVQTPAREAGFQFEALAFVAAVVAMACWAGPLAASLGAQTVQNALTVALPLTLSLQWFLRSRYLGRPHGLANLGRMPWVLAGVAVALAGLPSAALGADGAVAALLALTWTSGTVLMAARWSAAYAAAVGLATAAMLEGLLPLAVLAVVATATTAAAVVAAVRAAGAARDVTEARYPGRWGRALTAGTIGAGLGVLLVADSGVTWTMGPVPALALLPSTVASFWGGYHLWQFQQAVPRSLRGIAVTQRTARGLAWPGLRILVGAVARLVCAAAALSAALIVAASCLGWTVAGLGVLFGFGLIALATLLVSLLESVGRAGWALSAVAAGISAEVAFGVFMDAPFAGAGLILGAAVAVVVVLPPSVALLTRPATTLATSLWIT